MLCILLCPSLGGTRTQHNSYPPSPSSQGRPCAQGRPCVSVHKMDFSNNHHLSIGVREGMAKTTNKMALLKILPRGRKIIK